MTTTLNFTNAVFYKSNKTYAKNKKIIVPNKRARGYRWCEHWNDISITDCHGETMTYIREHDTHDVSSYHYALLEKTV